MSSSHSLPHHDRLESIGERIASDPRFVGLLAGGSLLHGGFDEHSDLDLILVVDSTAYPAAMAQRRAIAESFGGLLAAFTGEHVGEPRLLICLFGPAVLHVDLKFVTGDALDRLIEKPLVLFDRSGGLQSRLDRANVAWPDRDIAWFEERFWIWAHYAATKIGRGELLEAHGMLAFIAEHVLGPLCRLRERRPQRGVRRLEQDLPAAAREIATLWATDDRAAAKASLERAVDMYRRLTAGDTAEDQRLRAAVSGFIARI